MDVGKLLRDLADGLTKLFPQFVSAVGGLDLFVSFDCYPLNLSYFLGIRREEVKF